MTCRDEHRLRVRVDLSCGNMKEQLYEVDSYDSYEVEYDSLHIY